MALSAFRVVIVACLAACLLSFSTSVTAAEVEKYESELERNTQLGLIVHVLTSIVDILIENEKRIASGSLIPEPSPLAKKEKPTQTSKPTENDDFEVDTIEILPSPIDSVPGSYDIPIVPYEMVVLEPVVLHGLGGSPENLLPFVNVLRGNLPSAKFILPKAPVQFNSFANTTLASWFNIESNEIDAVQAEDEIVEAAQNIANIAEIQERVFGIERSRIAIIGLSQGGAVTLTTYLRHKWGGAVCISGYLPLAGTYPEAMTLESAAAPLLMMHGSVDEIVPVEGARLSAATIRTLGRDINYVELEGEDHRLDDALPKVFEATIALLNKVLQ